MAGIQNKTARQYNLKTFSKGRIATVRIAPGFNVVPDEHWNFFIKPKMDKYVAKLKKAGLISFGQEENDKELEQDGDTVAKSKVQNVIGKTVMGEDVTG